MPKLRVVTYNARGLQGSGQWKRFLQAATPWCDRRNVGVLIIQEHNWHPSTEQKRREEAAEVGAVLVIGWARVGDTGLYRGGVAMLIFTDRTQLVRVEGTSPDLVTVVVAQGEHEVTVQGVYLPSDPQERIAALEVVGSELKVGAVVGGDWNCVTDVTLDVQGANALAYPNVGAQTLAEAMRRVELFDIRREQLGNEHEHTRVGATCLTRLDRWYVPTESDALYNVKVFDDFRFKKVASDHLPVLLEVDWAEGERGHDRQTIREDLMLDPIVRNVIVKIIVEVYLGAGNQFHKWDKWTNMVRHELLKLTAERRKRDAPKVKALQAQLNMARLHMRLHGPSEANSRLRASLHAELQELREPDLSSPDDHWRAKQKDELCSAPFFKGNKDKAKQQWINEIKHTDSWEEGVEPNFSPQKVTQPKEIPEELAKYYRMLFREKVTQRAEARRLLNRMTEERKKGKGLSRASREEMDEPISEDEIYDVMETLPLGKQAGPDRIPNIVFRMLPKLLAPKLCRLLESALRKGKLPDSFLKGDIGLLFKKGDRDDVRNYRPITLLQGAYKIFTRVLARRMLRVVHEFVDESQKGFVPHTVIQDATMLTSLIEQYINDDCVNRKGLMVFLDMEKAFDRVSYSFLLGGLKAVGFGPRFRQTIKLMYDAQRPPQRRIYANGYYSDWFGIKSGVAQGCPVSPLLFLIVAQALRVAIEMEGVKGITIGEVITFISQFADDTTLLLKNTNQLRPAFRGVQRWCAATGMKENIGKRIGLPMGSYRGDSRFLKDSRTQHEYIRSIKWVQEDEWAISLGVPVGNDLNTEKWWRKKIEAVRCITAKWNIKRKGFFGRNLMVQAMYYGRYRYWVWSLPMSKVVINMIQADATQLIWAKDPDLERMPVRVRRFVQHRTAIGPRTQGGMREMLWAEHVRAIQANVVMRYLHPAKATWKGVLDAMLLRNSKGEELFGAGRGILMCELSIGERTKLLSALPKKSRFIKDCIRAHWARGITQDCSVKDGLAAEPLWHTPRFRIVCNWRVRHYFVNVLNVTQISDIIDYDTDRPFTAQRWREWIGTYHRDARAENITEEELDEKVIQIIDVVNQVPDDIIREITEPQNVTVSPKEMMALMLPDAQDEEGEVIYARIAETDNGTRFDICKIDAVGYEHKTGQRKALMRYDLHQVAWWGDRVQGPLESSFPLDKGWKINGETFLLSSSCVKDTYDVFMWRKFKRPPSEAGWEERLGLAVPWQRTWRVNGMYSSPRDKLTMAKLLRRNLFTASRNPETNGTCLLCNEQETQLHLVRCEVIHREYWQSMLDLMVPLNMPIPHHKEEIEAMLVTYRLARDRVVNKEQASIIDIAWRCLYAEIVRARVDNALVCLQSAKVRGIKMLQSRAEAYGRRWELWVIKQLGRKKIKTIPRKHQRYTIVKQRAYGSYTINPVLKAFQRRWEESGFTPTPRTRAARRVGRRRPPSPDRQPAESEAPPTSVEPDPWRDLSGDAKTTATARGGHAECNLATARNLHRNETLTREYMRDHQLGGRDGMDTRYPDWHMILQELIEEGECVVQFKMENIIDGDMLQQVRLAALYTLSPPHVVAVIRGEAGSVRLYDNDSIERVEGTHITLTTRQLVQRHGTMIAIVKTNSRLASAAPRQARPRPGQIREARRRARRASGRHGQ